MFSRNLAWQLPMRQHFDNQRGSGPAARMMQQDARVRRARLMAPPNAKVDPGIDLQRATSNTTVRPVAIAGQGSAQRSDTAWREGIAAQLYTLQHAVADIRSILARDLASAKRDRRVSPSIRVIQQMVAEFFHLSIEDLQSRRQDRAAVRARDMAFYLARELTGCSYSEIGRGFANRHHTTVMHGRDRIHLLTCTDPPTGAAIGKLSAIIRKTWRARRRVAAHKTQIRRRNIKGEW